MLLVIVIDGEIVLHIWNWLMAFAGLGWLLLLSPLAKHLSAYLMVLGFLAELSLCLWLVVKGVNVQRWKEQASAVIE